MISLNGTTKIITLSVATSFTAAEIYTAAVDWAFQAGSMQFLIPMTGSGKAPLGGGVYTDVIFVLTNGWKIQPSGYTAGDQITITGTLITNDSSARTIAPTVGGVPVWTFQVATYGTISVTGSGVSEQDKIDIANATINAGALTEDAFLALK